MNASEKIVLRRKRHLVATHVVINDTVIRELKNCGLMTDAIEDQLGAFSSNYARSTRYLDLLMKLTTKTDAFHTLCDYLNNLESSYPWLGDELLTELRMETGNMAPDEYLVKEAKELVHVYFGGAKRLSEKEKRTLEHVIAIRTQCAKEIWRNNFESVRLEMEAERSMNTDRELQFKSILTRLASLVETHRKKIYRVSNAPLSGNSYASPLPPPTSSGPSPGNNNNHARPSSVLTLDDDQGQPWSDDQLDVAEKLSQGIEELNTLTATVTTEYDNLLEEKFKALSFMEAENGVISPSAKSGGAGSGRVRNRPVAGRLDEQVPTWLKKMTTQLNNVQFRADEAENKVKSLEEKLRGIRREYEDDLKGKDHTIRVLAENLETVQRANSGRDEELNSLSRQLHAARSELKVFKTKTHYLSKSRHLGYGYVYDSFSGGAEELDPKERIRLGGGMKYRLRGPGGGREKAAGGNDSFLPRIYHSSPESLGDSIGYNRRKFDRPILSKVGSVQTTAVMVNKEAGPPAPESFRDARPLAESTKEAFSQLIETRVDVEDEIKDD